MGVYLRCFPVHKPGTGLQEMKCHLITAGELIGKMSSEEAGSLLEENLVVEMRVEEVEAVCPLRCL